ncbi:MAG: SIS domain-containing protein [Erysipelotrichaceae bacterium]|nr:SIS domain-containing protein [Erysipelotrichaceae bacterium]MDY5251300.1 SIS domain-containing protein [Erysipelotrichaceae bacterium]
MDISYIKIIKNLIDIVEKEEEKNILDASKLMSDAIINHHSIFTFGASHAGILSEEMYYRAGGLVVINPIFGREIMLDTTPITQTSRMERLNGYGTALVEKTPVKSGDVVIVHSVSGRNPVSIDVAIECKKRGAKIVVITNLSYSKEVSSRHVSGKKLYELADIVIDNHGEKGDACVKIEGLEQKVAPSSTVIGGIIVNSLVSLTTAKLVESGIHPVPIFYSANIDGGDELNQQVYQQYKDQIHYQF